MNLNKSLLAPNLLFKLDAWFLIVAGSLAGCADLLSYFKRSGVWGQLFYSNPLIVGFFEAHILAVIIGVIFLRLLKSKDYKFISNIGITVHGVLGTSNIIWFDGFAIVDAVTIGIVATAIHFAFVVLYIITLFFKR